MSIDLNTPASLPTVEWKDLHFDHKTKQVRGTYNVVDGSGRVLKTIGFTLANGANLPQIDADLQETEQPGTEGNHYDNIMAALALTEAKVDNYVKNKSIILGT